MKKEERKLEGEPGRTECLYSGGPFFLTFLSLSLSTSLQFTHSVQPATCLTYRPFNVGTACETRKREKEERKRERKRERKKDMEKEKTA